MTSPRTCATGSPTSCTGCRPKPCRAGAPIPARLPPDTPVFNVPSELVKILDRDLCAGSPAGQSASGHRQARRPGPDARRSRLAAHLRDAAEQGRGCSADGTSRDASQRHRPDDERLHRSEAARRARRPRRAAGAAAWAGDQAEGEAVRATGTDGLQRNRCNACTNACTNF